VGCGEECLNGETGDDRRGDDDVIGLGGEITGNEG